MFLHYGDQICFWNLIRCAKHTALFLWFLSCLCCICKICNVWLHCSVLPWQYDLRYHKQILNISSTVPMSFCFNRFTVDIDSSEDCRGAIRWADSCEHVARVCRATTCACCLSWVLKAYRMKQFFCGVFTAHFHIAVTIKTRFNCHHF